MLNNTIAIMHNKEIFSYNTSGIAISLFSFLLASVFYVILKNIGKLISDRFSQA